MITIFLKGGVILEIAKEIVIAMLENGYLNKYTSDEKNIEIVKKAYDEIYKQLRDTKSK